MSGATIPTIDVRGLSGTAQQRRDVGLAIIDAYRVWGFGYLIGHPIDPSLIAEVFVQSQAFHALPLDTKLTYAVGRDHRGYIPMKSSTDVASSIERATKPNVSESFMIMREFAPDSSEVLHGQYLAGPNRWPSEPPEFRSTMLAYHDAMWTFAAALMEVIGEALGDDGVLARSCAQPTTWLRLLHYPPQDPQAPSDEYGSAPHTDFGAITLLAQDEVGGLSVRTQDGDWVNVPPLADSFVMNVGDMLHRWSNGLLTSTPHRVTNRTGRERYSVPFFFDPDVRTRIEPLPSCITADRPAQFEPLLFEDFLRTQLEASYVNHQAAQP
jgi:isopenicillin N synthase-like dioxygenase